MNPTPSTTLLTAAVAGLLTAIACNQTADDHHQDDTDTLDTPKETDTTDTPEYGITDRRELPDLTFAQFSTDCAARGGLVQTHATCAGNNACRGMSFNKWSKELTEHSCRALNSCGGASCVVLPDDEGRAPEDVYDQMCGSMCHGEAFTVFTPPGADLEVALAQFEARTTTALVSRVAFGLTGHNESGTAFANMPAFYSKLSRAEIERLVTYLQTLEAEAAHYAISGETEDFTDAE